MITKQFTKPADYQSAAISPFLPPRTQTKTRFMWPDERCFMVAAHRLPACPLWRVAQPARRVPALAGNPLLFWPVKNRWHTQSNQPGIKPVESKTGKPVRPCFALAAGVSDLPPWFMDTVVLMAIKTLMGVNDSFQSIPGGVCGRPVSMPPMMPTAPLHYHWWATCHRMYGNRVEKVFADNACAGVFASELTGWSLDFWKGSRPKSARGFVQVSKRWVV